MRVSRRPGRGEGGGRGAGAARRGEEEEEQVRVVGGGAGWGARPPLPHRRGRLARAEGGEWPGTRRPRRGMEEEAAAADVIWLWAEQVMEKGSMTPGVGIPRMGS